MCLIQQHSTSIYIKELTSMPPSCTSSTWYYTQCGYISSVLLQHLPLNVFSSAGCVRDPHTRSPVSGRRQNMLMNAGGQLERLNCSNIGTVTQNLTRKLVV